MKTKLATALAGVLLLTGCSVPAPNPSGSADDIQIVASTSVWADITKTIAGDALNVQAILTNPNQDPHSYEATPKDQLAVSKADLVIAACNSTDSFIEAITKPESLLCLAPAEDHHAEESADHADHGSDENPHVWYSLTHTIEVAGVIQQELAKRYPSDAAKFQENYKNFADQAAAILDAAKLELQKLALPSRDFIAIENLASELLVELGQTDATSEEVAQAGLNETELSPAQLKRLEHSLFEPTFFIYNESTRSSQTDAILEYLNDNTCNDVGTADCLRKSQSLGFFEQLPAGKTYLTWMQGNIDAILEMTKSYGGNL